MSVTSRNPLRMAGANVNSGFPATGEVPFTRGGMLTACLFSGNVVSGGAAALSAPGALVVGSDAMIASGAGRLNTIMPITMAPGTACFIYDAATVASGGPFVLSGHKTLAVLPAWPMNGPASGNGPLPIQVDMPFTSGLCIGFKSGMNVFSISYTPETNQLFN